AVMKTLTNVMLIVGSSENRQDMNMNLISNAITAGAHQRPVPAPTFAPCQGYTWNVSSPPKTAPQSQLLL
ncbi:hypothetical protein EWB00_002069, partial [Schistosoma japonicum]